MRTIAKQLILVITTSFLVLGTGCKKKEGTTEAPSNAKETVQVASETVQSLSEKAREEQNRKIREEEERIAAENARIAEQARLEREADSVQRVLALQRQQARADSIAAVERERLAEIERQRLARIEEERRARLEEEKRRAEEALRQEQACKCKPKTFKVQSAHSWAEFRMPAAKKGKIIKINGGAYNKYVFPKCNRVWWSNLIFSCDPKACKWVRVEGKWDADALCHGSAGNSPYVKVGTR